MIGRCLVRKLHELGAEVTVGDLKDRPKEFASTISYRKGDLNTLPVGEWECDFFFHLAAAFERSVESPQFWQENWKHNVLLSHHLSQAVITPRIVFASSYLVYDPTLYFRRDSIPLSERSCVQPRNLCGAAKLYFEKELLFLFETKSLSSVAARIFRIYGEGSKDVISRWIAACRNGEQISVYDKEGMFDYIFAEDAAEGLLRLAISEAEGGVNLGSGRGRRVSDVIKILSKHFPAMSILEEEREEQVECSVADISFLQEYTDWKPNISLEEGIGRLVGGISV